jgi:hypothetical protein
MWVGTTKRGEEFARHANEAEARSCAREKLLAKVLLILYLVYASELAIAIVAAGGGWYALSAPLLAACGPRYWKNSGQRVAFYSGWVVLWAIIAVWLVVSPPSSSTKGGAKKPGRRAEAPLLMPDRRWVSGGIALDIISQS